MIIAALDDLLFSSKIRSVARPLGIEIVFARTPEAVVSVARARKPTLVVLDLDARRIRPIDVLEGLKQDPDTASVRTIGFVSHVRGDIIQAARAAGADEILARSAFAASLPDLIARAG